VFSIVGVKMGIRAREILEAGPDVLKVVSYAGTTPPYSCLNDGIQVSTGSTLGIGLIEVRKTRKPGPSAGFTHGDRTIRITLKDEYLRQVEADIREGVTKYGLSDDAYWQLIRQNAIKYWLEWDRKNIFDIKEVTR
ncbi:MAG: formylmethanofuran dehydrogenase subunit E family protein, partial [Bacteroidales bacterium]|nr:formylmethanofuran dehydrogenase subunit E family protein [Bacteroidales bacterium]